ncbi:hypothetical protein PTKIN_Ptkin16aG0059000 [Pterospermum kingtungense]
MAEEINLEVDNSGGFNLLWKAATLGDFPAPMFLCTITSFIGVIITTMFQLLQVYDLEWYWPLVSVRDLIGCSLLEVVWQEEHV